MGPTDQSWLLVQMLDQADAFAYAMDLELRYLYLNKKALVEGYGGRRLEEIVGKRGRDFFPPGMEDSDLDELEANDRRVLDTGRPMQVYEVLLGAVLYSCKWPLCSDDGKTWGVAGVSFDVTSVVEERARGAGDDHALMMDIVRSNTRMTQALMRSTALLAKRST